MGGINRFEDLKCWQGARELCRTTYAATQEGSFAKDFSLKDQILRASGSVMDNIAEGFGRGGNKEFVQFLFIAKSSCEEVKSQTYRALDRRHINESTFEEVSQLATEVSKTIQGLISYLHKSDRKGFKKKF